MAATTTLTPTPGILYIIGLGLGDHRDITHRGSAALSRCDLVFLESYTSILCEPLETLEKAFGKKIEVAYRETVESESDMILGPALAGKSVGFLVVGDPFGATTHTDLLLRARAAGITTRVIHNASIMNAVGACGLQLYTFGQTVSIPFFRNAWQPTSFYDRIAFNASGGLHTLCLLDIKVREPDFDLLVRTGRKAFLPPRFMTIHRAIAQLLSVEGRLGKGVCTPTTPAIGMARVGQDDELIVSGTLGELMGVDFGGPLHSLVIVGGTPHDIEADMMAHYALGGVGGGGGSSEQQYTEDFGEEWNGEALVEEEEEEEEEEGEKGEKEKGDK